MSGRPGPTDIDEEIQGFLNTASAFLNGLTTQVDTLLNSLADKGGSANVSLGAIENKVNNKLSACNPALTGKAPRGDASKEETKSMDKADAWLEDYRKKNTVVNNSYEGMKTDRYNGTVEKDTVVSFPIRGFTTDIRGAALDVSGLSISANVLSVKGVGAGLSVTGIGCSFTGNKQDSTAIENATAAMVSKLSAIKSELAATADWVGLQGNDLTAANNGLTALQNRIAALNTKV